MQVGGAQGATYATMGTRWLLTWPSQPLRIPSLTLARPWLTTKTEQVAVQIQDVQFASPWIIDQISFNVRTRRDKFTVKVLFRHEDLQFSCTRARFAKPNRFCTAASRPGPGWLVHEVKKCGPVHIRQPIENHEAPVRPSFIASVRNRIVPTLGHRGYGAASPGRIFRLPGIPGHPSPDDGSQWRNRFHRRAPPPLGW